MKMKTERFNQVLSHFGVYGICEKNNRLMCIKKSSGPYKERFDLPGGSPKLGEGLIDTLKREFLEETGYSVHSITHNRIYDAFVQEQNKDVIVHHVFVLYSVTIESKKQKIPEFVEGEKNDSDGIEWISFSDLTCDNASPVILKVLEEIKGENLSFESEIYLDWKVRSN